MITGIALGEAAQSVSVPDVSQRFPLTALRQAPPRPVADGLWPLTLAGVQAVAAADDERLQAIPQRAALLIEAAGRDVLPLVALPLGYVFEPQPDPSGLRTAAPDAAALAAGVAALFCRLAVTGEPPDRWLSHALGYVDGADEQVELALLRVGHVIGWGDEAAALRYVRGDDLPGAKVAQALYCLLNHPADSAAALLCALRSRSRRDCVAGLTGALCGVLVELPAGWQQNCDDDSTPSVKLAQRLIQMRLTMQR